MRTRATTLLGGRHMASYRDGGSEEDAGRGWPEAQPRQEPAGMLKWLFHRWTPTAALQAASNGR